MSSTDEIARILSEIPDLALIGGVYVQASGVQAVVDVGQARVAVPTVGANFPVPGEAVRLLRVGKQIILLGPAAPRAPIGRVAATGSPRCTVEYPAGSGVTQLMGYPSNITPAVNDVVLLDWTSGGTIVDRITIAPGVVTPEFPGGGGGGGQQTQVFTARDAGTINTSGGSYWQAQVWASDSTFGVYVYGSKIRDTIPDSAVIQSAEIYLPPVSVSGGAPNLQVHNLETRSGLPSFRGSSAALSPRTGWVPIPVAFLNDLKANPGGVGFNHGGFNKYKALAADATSGSLRVTYST